jgi:hypothetical protein
MSVGAKAVIYPLISKTVFFWLVAAASLVIVMSVLLLPNQLETCDAGCDFYKWVYSTATSIPGIRVLTIRSSQPFVLAISYFFSLIAGLLLGILACCCSADVRAIRLYVSGLTRLKRILYFAGMCLLWWLVIFTEPAETNKYQFSHGFWESLKASRYTLLYFCLGISGLTCGFILWIVNELANFFVGNRE